MLIWPQGTRMYQAINVLRGHSEDPPTPQDYMDDAESFLYVLGHLVFLYQRPGSHLPVLPEFLREWQDCDPVASSDSKFLFLADGFRPSQFPAWWGKAVRDLIQGFQRLFLVSIGLRGPSSAIYSTTTQSGSVILTIPRMSRRTTRLYWPCLTRPFHSSRMRAIVPRNARSLNHQPIPQVRRKPPPILLTRRPPPLPPPLQTHHMVVVNLQHHFSPRLLCG